MTYNPGIPQPNDLLSTSQPQIQTNFSQANTIFDANHFTFDSATAANRGKHRKVVVVEQATSPGTALDEMAIYTKDVGGITQLFLQRANIAPAGADIQLTPAVLGDPQLVGTNGTTFLPGGFIMKFGLTSANGTTAITWAGLGLTNFPNNCFLVIGQPSTNAGPNAANDYVYTFGVSTTGFSATGVRRITLQATPVNFYFIAIGN